MSECQSQTNNGSSRLVDAIKIYDQISDSTWNRTCVSAVDVFSAFNHNWQPFIPLQNCQLTSSLTFPENCDELTPLHYWEKHPLFIVMPPLLPLFLQSELSPSFFCSIFLKPQAWVYGRHHKKINTFLIVIFPRSNKTCRFPECSLSATCVLIRELECWPLLKR